MLAFLRNSGRETQGRKGALQFSAQRQVMFVQAAQGDGRRSQFLSQMVSCSNIRNESGVSLKIGTVAQAQQAGI
jgi:hypothetical protein